MDGYTLMYNVNTEFGALPLLKKLILNYRAISIFLSVSSVIFELSWIVAPFFSEMIVPLVVASWMFHLGIYCAMSPNYLPQCVCYLLLIDWNSLGKVLGLISTDMSSPTIPVSEYTPTMIIASHFATIFCVFLLHVMVFRIEGWPITSIPIVQ